MPRRRVGRWRGSECAGRCRSRHRPATAPVRVRDPAGGGPGAGEAPGADAPRSAPRQPAGLHPQVAEVLRAQPIEPAGPNTSTSPPHGRLRSAAPGSPVDHARRPPLHPVGREHREQRRGQVDDDRHAPAEQHPGEPPGAVRPARGPVDQEQAGVDHREHEQVDVHPLDRLGPPAGLLVLSVAGRGLVRCGSAALFQLRRHLVHLLNQLGLLERLAAGPSAPPHKGRSAVLDTWAPEAGAGGLGPWRDRRASASAVDKPSSAVPRSASTSSASSRPARANAPASPGGLAVGFLAVPASGRGRSSVPMVLAALRAGGRSRCGPSTGRTSRAAVGQVETIRLAVTHLHTDAYEIDIRGHRLTVDQPVEAGGANLGPTPTELFAASLAACVGFYAGRFLRPPRPGRRGVWWLWRNHGANVVHVGERPNRYSARWRPPCHWRWSRSAAVLVGWRPGEPPWHSRRSWRCRWPTPSNATAPAPRSGRSGRCPTACWSGGGRRGAHPARLRLPATPASRARSAGAYPAAVGPVLVAPWLLIAGEATRKALTRHRVRPHGARPKVPT